MLSTMSDFHESPPNTRNFFPEKGKLVVSQKARLSFRVSTRRFSTVANVSEQKQPTCTSRRNHVSLDMLAAFNSLSLAFEKQKTKAAGIKKNVKKKSFSITRFDVV